MCLINSNITKMKKEHITDPDASLQCIDNLKLADFAKLDKVMWLRNLGRT